MYRESNISLATKLKRPTINTPICLVDRPKIIVDRYKAEKRLGEKYQALLIKKHGNLNNFFNLSL